MKKRVLFAAALLALVLIFAAVLGARWQTAARAQELAPGAPGMQGQFPATLSTTHCSASFCLDWQVLTGGLGPMESASYRLRATLGQTMAGLFEGSSYTLRTGYWAGIETGDEVFLPALFRP